MAYNYAAAYGTSYGQYAAQQPSSFSSQQQTSTAGYGNYGQTATAYGTASSAASTSTTATNMNTPGYGATGSASTTAAQSAYNFGYGYNYGADQSTQVYNTPTATSNALQAFHQSWYNSTAGAAAATTTASQQTATTAQTTTQQHHQQQQYSQQYLQQYQQQMSTYQQYASNATAKTDNQQQQQHQPTNWGTYSQQHQQRHATQPTSNRTEATKTGWGAFQQQTLPTQQTTGSSNQQKATGVVYRSPMKYTTDTQQYGTASNVMHQSYGNNQTFKSPSSNTSSHSYTGVAQSYNTPQQNYGVSSNQNFAGNQNFQSSAPQQQQQQQYRGNQGVKNTQQAGAAYAPNQGYQSGQNYGGNSNFQGNQNRGFSGGPNTNNNVPMGVNMQGAQGGVIRPLMAQRSPMSGNTGYTGTAPRNGPDIPPFPRAWHAQDQREDWQAGRGFGEQRERWGRGPGGNNQQPPPQQPQQQPTQQIRPMYNTNSRNVRGTNRELWSPAAKSGPKSEKDGKTTPSKREEVEKVDKDKPPEIKSFLYAWLGARHTRPTYDIRQIGERPSIMFRCDLRVDNFSFVGVGKATSKKDAQTTAAWKFAEYLVKIGEITESELPSKHFLPDDVEGDIGDVREEEGNVYLNKARRDSEDRNRTRDRRVPNRGRGQRRGNPGNWGPPPELMGEIPPLMALPVGPWGGPPMGPPPPMMGPPPPALMDFGPPLFWEEGWVRPPMGMGPPLLPMGPPMHMRPPPPFMRKNQNDFWRRRDIEERMMDLSRGLDWAQPEDMFISQMIRNQQEDERRQRGPRPMPPMEASPGEWERVQQTRPVITSDDRHVMSKHAEIYPQEGELKSLHRIVNTVEQALKQLSDKFVDEDHPKDDTPAKKEASEKTEQDPVKKEVKKKEPDEKEKEEEPDEKEKKEDGESKAEKNDSEKKDESEKKEEQKKEEKRAKIKILKRPKRAPKQVDTRPRVLCGVNRIGPLAKGLLITKDDHVELALLCGEIPTTKLLERILEHLEDKLCEVDEEFKLVVIKKEEEAGFLVKSLDEKSPVEVMVILTAMALRKPPKKEVEKKSDKKKEQEKEDEDVAESKGEEPDPVGMLPKRKMLEVLACLRHTHWFQAKACSIQSCVILTRILRDLQRRDEVWDNLTEWAIEVLIYNSITSSEEQMSPGDACRRFFEVVAGGILMPGMPGIVDPCEKGQQCDVLDCLETQGRESITRSAQRYLRHLAFREIHIILGMEKLLPSYRAENHPGQNKPNTREQGKASGQKEGEEKERPGEANNQRKRRFEHNGSDSVAESPKRSLTDEEDTDTQQNLAELSISDEASEGRSALEEAESETKEQVESLTEASDELVSPKGTEGHMETTVVPELTKEEEDALLEEKMDT